MGRSGPEHPNVGYRIHINPPMLQDDVKEVQSRLAKMMAAFKSKVTTSP